MRSWFSSSAHGQRRALNHREFRDKGRGSGIPATSCAHDKTAEMRDSQARDAVVRPRGMCAPRPSQRGRPRRPHGGPARGQVQTLNLAAATWAENPKCVGKRFIPDMGTSKNVARVIIYRPGNSPTNIGLVHSSTIPHPCCQPSMSPLTPGAAGCSGLIGEAILKKLIFHDFS